MSLNPNHLVTLAEQRAWLGIAPAVVQAEIDLIIENCINTASSLIEACLSRKLILGTATEVFHGDGTRHMDLLQWPIRTVVSIEEAFTNTFDATSIVAPSDYSITPSETFITLTNRPTHYRSNIAVTYTYGYDSPSTPGIYPLEPVLSHAAKLYAEWIYQVRNDRRLGINSKNKNGESVNYSMDVPDFIEKMLAPFKRELFMPVSTGSRWI